jgi:GNAT superfamily N-acetyltransferase
MGILDNIVYVKPSKQDLHMVLEIWRECYPDNTEMELSYLEHIYKYFEDFFVVARERDTGRVVGAIFGTLWCSMKDYFEDTNKWRGEDNFIEYRSKHGHIFTTETFCVIPEYRNQGLGEAMGSYLHDTWIFDGLGGPNTDKVTHMISYIGPELDKMLTRLNWTKIEELGDFPISYVEYNDPKLGPRVLYAWEKLKK